jgi:hypothetical protein
MIYFDYYIARLDTINGKVPDCSSTILYSPASHAVLQTIIRMMINTWIQYGQGISFAAAFAN